MGKYIVAEDRYVLINVYSDDEGNLKDFTVDYDGLSLSEYANLLCNALVKKAIRIGIEKEELLDAVSNDIVEIYENMEGREHE